MQRSVVHLCVYGAVNWAYDSISWALLLMHSLFFILGPLRLHHIVITDAGVVSRTIALATVSALSFRKLKDQIGSTAIICHSVLNSRLLPSAEMQSSYSERVLVIPGLKLTPSAIMVEEM